MSVALVFIDQYQRILVDGVNETNWTYPAIYVYNSPKMTVGSDTFASTLQEFLFYISDITAYEAATIAKGQKEVFQFNSGQCMACLNGCPLCQNSPANCLLCNGSNVQTNSPPTCSITCAPGYYYDAQEQQCKCSFVNAAPTYYDIQQYELPVGYAANTNPDNNNLLPYAVYSMRRLNINNYTGPQV